MLLASLAAMVIRPVRAPPVAPTIRVVRPNTTWYSDNPQTVQVSADKYCKVVETSLDARIGSTIRARYASIGNAWGQPGVTYVCGETAPIYQYGVGIYGSPFIPNTGLLPEETAADTPVLRPVRQTFANFAPECQAAIAWCGNT